MYKPMSHKHEHKHHPNNAKFKEITTSICSSKQHNWMVALTWNAYLNTVDGFIYKKHWCKHINI